MCSSEDTCHREGSGARRAFDRRWLSLFGLIIGLVLVVSPARGQDNSTEWQTQVRKYAEAQDWDSAMRIVNREVARTPQDMDVRAWRARVLAWSGRLKEAEKEYLEILKVARSDPDYWMGLAGVYSREGRTGDALQALDRAMALDPKRADLHSARGRALRAAGQRNEARMEFQRALNLDPTSAEARAGLISMRSAPRHAVRFGEGNDLFNFTGANHDGWISLASQWTPHWTTSFAGNFYERAGIGAGKFSGAITGRLQRWGAVTAGGAAGHDNA